MMKPERFNFNVTMISNIFWGILCVFSFILVSHSRSMAEMRGIPVPNENEALGWSAKYNGPVLYEKEIVSEDDLKQNCYSELLSEKQKSDCLVTFSENQTVLLDSSKLDKASAMFLSNSFQIEFTAFLRLKKLDMPNPAEYIVMQTYINRDLFQYGVLNAKEEEAKYRRDLLDLRFARYSALENELKSMEGVSIIRYLSGIDWVEVKITKKSIPFLESTDYIKSVYIPDPDDISEFAWVHQPEILKQIQMHEPFYVANDGNNEPDYFEGLLNNYPYEPDRIVVAVFDATGFNGDHVIWLLTRICGSVGVAGACRGCAA